MNSNTDSLFSRVLRELRDTAEHIQFGEVRVNLVIHNGEIKRIDFGSTTKMSPANEKEGYRDNNS